MDLVCAKEVKYELDYKELIKYTNNFSKDNYIGEFQFGKVYHGKIEQSTHETRHVLVKIWEDEPTFNYAEGDNETRLMQETTLLRHEKLKNHPWSIELYGYCWDDEHLGIVYNLKPLDTVHNLAPKDSFTWLQRIKVAIGFARHLKYLHTADPTYKPFLVRNISGAHIILDEEYNPRLFDFSMISGGILPDKTIYKCYYLSGCVDYIDKYTNLTGKWGKWTDVFAFGCLLLSLITKRVYTEESDHEYTLLAEWAWDNYKGDREYPLLNSWAWIKGDRSETNPSSLVDLSLETDYDFSMGDARKITKLAMCCINPFPSYRPTMKQVVKKLMKLEVVKKHSKFLGLDKIVR